MSDKMDETNVILFYLVGSKSYNVSKYQSS